MMLRKWIATKKNNKITSIPAFGYKNKFQMNKINEKKTCNE